MRVEEFEDVGYEEGFCCWDGGADLWGGMLDFEGEGGRGEMAAVELGEGTFDSDV